MRQTLKVLEATAGLFVASHAIYSDYWLNWQQIMDEINCQDGPVACGIDEDGNNEFCMDGYACL